QPFEGLVIAAKHGRGLDGTFTVRKIAEGVGVEKIYPLHSPTIDKIEILKTSKVRRAKLYYMRERSGKSAKMKGEVSMPEFQSETKNEA
ncbi:MAG: LSU ribosomal protein L19P, partial [Parcubacteria group bacterium LiPW_39]